MGQRRSSDDWSDDQDEYDVENPRRRKKRKRRRRDSYEPPRANFCYICGCFCCIVFLVIYICAACYFYVWQQNCARQEAYNQKVNKHINDENNSLARPQEQGGGGGGGVLKMMGMMMGLQLVGGL